MNLSVQALHVSAVVGYTRASKSDGQERIFYHCSVAKGAETGYDVTDCGRDMKGGGGCMSVIDSWNVAGRIVLRSDGLRGPS